MLGCFKESCQFGRGKQPASDRSPYQNEVSLFRYFTHLQTSSGMGRQPEEDSDELVFIHTKKTVWWASTFHLF